MTQRCGRCKQTLPMDSFAPSYRGKPGTWCRPCFAAYLKGDRSAPAQHAEQKCTVCGTMYVPKRLAANAAYCSPTCKEQGRKESGRQREQHLLRTYGITQADYDRMLAEQGGHCALCPATPETLTVGRYRTFLHVDHCHDSGEVRGLLCPDCNLKLGRVSADWMRAALVYLTR